MSIENVKAFYERLATDEAFRAQIQGVESKEECSQIVKGAGYDFTQEEFEEYTADLLDPSATDGKLRELDEKELEAVFGGASSMIYKWHQIQPLYGIVRPPVQQLYGVFQPDT